MARHNGRPSENLIKQVNARFTEEDYTTLRRLEDERGMFVSDVVRHFVTSALRPRLP